jgi:hypothetical protein
LLHSWSSREDEKIRPAGCKKEQSEGCTVKNMCGRLIIHYMHENCRENFFFFFEPGRFPISIKDMMEIEKISVCFLKIQYIVKALSLRSILGIY